MKTITKIVLAAAAGYALRAYATKDAILSNEALKHSVDRRISVEDQQPSHSEPTFMDRQARKLGGWLGYKLTALVIDNAIQNTRYARREPASAYRRFYMQPHTSTYGRHYSRPTRFGRRSSN